MNILHSIYIYTLWVFQKLTVKIILLTEKYLSTDRIKYFSFVNTRYASRFTGPFLFWVAGEYSYCRKLRKNTAMNNFFTIF